MALVIRNSKIHSSGCYTTCAIKKGTWIVEYTGKRLTKHQADAMYESARRTYLFGLDDGRVIDGDGVAAFINHSCAPNCEPDEIDQRVWIIASRDIRVGEELTYDYNLYDGDVDDKAMCVCGAPECRGSMYSEDELKKRAKVAKTKSRDRKKAAGKQKPAKSAAGRRYMARKRKADALRRIARAVNGEGNLARFMAARG
jgi:uncharacterized protein